MSVSDLLSAVNHKEEDSMQEAMAVDERRIKSRFNIKLQASMKEFSLSESKPALEAEVMDLSEEGAGLNLKGKLNQGSIAKLALNIPGWDRYLNEFYKEGAASSQPFVALVEVVWTNVREESEVGVKFVGIDEGHRKALSRFLSKSMISNQHAL